LNTVVENAYIELEGHRSPLSLDVFTLGGINVVLGMDWLSMFEATIVCKQKMIRLKTPNGSQVTVYGDREPQVPKVIYMTRVNKL
jgi:hypothetical protein